MEKTTKTPKLTDKEAQLSASIMHAVEIDSSFKLYSFRVISEEQFINRVLELTQIYKTNFKNES